MTISPEQLASAGNEHAHQTALFCWASLPETRRLYPQLQLMFAVPNGGERNIAVAGQLKAEGVKAGVPDIFLPVPILRRAPQAALDKWVHGLFIEMKFGNNKPSEKQNQWASALHANGYQTSLCYSWIEAKDTLIAYLASA